MCAKKLQMREKKSKLFYYFICSSRGLHLQPLWTVALISDQIVGTNGKEGGKKLFVLVLV